MFGFYSIIFVNTKKYLPKSFGGIKKLFDIQRFTIGQISKRLSLKGFFCKHYHVCRTVPGRVKKSMCMADQAFQLLQAASAKMYVVITEQAVERFLFQDEGLRGPYFLKGCIVYGCKDLHPAGVDQRANQVGAADRRLRKGTIVDQCPGHHFEGIQEDKGFI